MYHNNSEELKTNSEGIEVVNNLGVGRYPSPIYGIYQEFNATDANVDNKVAYFSDGNFSGADNTDGDREQGGIRIDIDSTADGDANDEHRLYGVWSDVRYSGFTDLARAGYFYVENNMVTGSEQTQETVGVYASAISDGTSSTAGTNNLKAVQGQASVQNAGYALSSYGGFFQGFLHSTRSIDTNQIVGVRGEVEVDSTNSITLGNARAVQAVIDVDSTTPTITNSFLYYGGYEGDTSNITNKYGIYLIGSDNINRISGKTAIGDITNPAQKLHVSAGHLRLDDTYKIEWGGSNARIDGSNASDYLRFFTSDTERLNIASDGTIKFNAYGAGYLKTDANGVISVDTSTIEDTLQSVTDRGSTTTNNITLDDNTTESPYVGYIDNSGASSSDIEYRTYSTNGNFLITRTGNGGADIMLSGHATDHTLSTTTFAGDVLLGDAKKLKFGAAPDYEIYHNNTTNVNHVSSLLDRQLSLNANIIQLTNQANSTTYLKLESTGATFTGDLNINKTDPKITLFDNSGANPDPSGSIVFSESSGVENFDITYNGANDRLEFRGRVNGSDNVDLMYISRQLTTPLQVQGGATFAGNINAGSNTVTAATFIGDLNGTINTATTAATQSASDNSTKVATTAYVDTAVTNLVDSSPAALDTLNELAAALGDDANFSTTVTNSIATKVAKAGDTMTGNLVLNNSVNLRFKNNAGAERNILTLDTNDDVQFGGSIDDIRFLTNDSSDKMIIKSDGKVGVGTISPQNILHVHQSDADSHSYVHITQEDGGSASTDGMSIGVLDGGVNASVRLRENGYLNFWTNNTERMRIASDGKVGIGTTSPERALHIDANGGRPIIQIDKGGDKIFSVGTGTSTNDDDNTILQMFDENTEKIRLFTVGHSYFNGGHVGIGTTSPGNPLHIYKNATIGAITSTTVANAGLRIQDSGANMYVDGNSFVIDTAGYLTTTGSSDFDIGTNSTSRIKIKGDGKVGIATSSPDFTLDVEADKDTWISRIYNTGSDANAQSLLIRSDATSAHDALVMGVYADSGYKMVVRSTGNVGIGTTSPTNPLTIHSSYTAGILLGNTTNATAGRQNLVDFRMEASDNVMYVCGQIGSEAEGTWTSTSGTRQASLVFNSVKDGNNTERLRITSDGNVGIGTASPSAIIETSSSATGNTVGALLTNTNGSGTADSVSLNFGLGRSADSYIRSVPAIKLLKEQQWTGTASTVDASLVFSTVSDETTSERMRIDSDGHILLGTDNKVGWRYSSGDISYNFITGEDQILTLTGGTWTSTATQTAVRIKTQQGEKITVLNSGATGIGTSSPLQKLHVVGKALITDDFQLTGSNPRIDFNSNGSSSLRFYDTTNASERMRIDSSGNVGIGTSSPDTGYQLTLSDSSTAGLVLNDTGQSGNYQIGANGTTSYWRFDGDNTKSISLNSTGNVGVGVINASAKLEISHTDTMIRMSDSDGTNQYLELGHNNGSSTYVSRNNTSMGTHVFYTADGTSTTERMRISSDGDVLLGTTGTPNGTSVYGSAFTDESSDRMVLFQATSTTTEATLQAFYNPNGQVGRINTSGSSTIYYTSSDYRLKEDLQDFAGLKMVSKIPVYNFKWKADDSRSYGVMAHELQEVVPQAVSGHKDEEDNQMVDYSKLVPILLKSIQELEARVQELEKEI